MAGHKKKGMKAKGMMAGGQMKAKGMKAGGKMKAKGMMAGGKMKAKGMRRGGSPRPKPRQDATGQNVKNMQRILGLMKDSVKGPVSDAEYKKFMSGAKNLAGMAGGGVKGAISDLELGAFTSSAKKSPTGKGGSPRPKPQRKKYGGSMKAKGMAQGGKVATKTSTRGGATGGMRKPSNKKSGLYGR